MSKLIAARDSGFSRSRKTLAVGAVVAIGLAITAQGFTLRDDDALVLPQQVADSAVALVTAKPLNGVCPTFREGKLISVRKRVALRQNFIEDCDVSLTIFAMDRAVFVGHPENHWTDAAEDLTVGPLDPALTVPLVIWNGTGKSLQAFASIAVADIDRANSVLSKERAGIVLERQPDIRSFEPRRGYDIKFGCNALGDSLGFAIDASALNVVYLNHFVDTDRDGNETSNTMSGYACIRPDQPPAVVLLSLESGNDLTLAHEIGHTLGLSSEEFPISPGGGHTTGRAGFDEKNLMWRSVLPHSDPRTRIAEGQIFRFHVDRRSWINRTGLRTSKLQLVCQEEKKDGALEEQQKPPDAKPCLRLSAGEEGT